LVVLTNLQILFHGNSYAPFFNILKMNVLTFIMHFMHIQKMTEIYWPLEVLSRSVHYPNLSTAADHVGLSQSQLSRVLKQLETYFGYELLDRKIKRKSMWTPKALELAEVFLTHHQRLQNQFQLLKSEQQIHELSMVCLEGLIEHGAQLLNKVSKQLAVPTIRLDVFDLDELEERYLREEYDLLLSMRIPNRAKPKYQHTLGFQNPEIRSNKNPALSVLSLFEAHQKQSRKKKASKTVISNSLLVRRIWVDKYGGTGVFPSEDLKTRGEIEISLVAQPNLPEHIWKILTS